jgi:hypothetical protein
MKRSAFDRKFVSCILLASLAISFVLLPLGRHPLRAEEKVEAKEEKKEPVPPLPFVDGSWTLVLLPDTQKYCSRYPGLYDAQTNWIVRNKDSHNIKYVLHMGDITDNGSAKQWQRAKESMSLLDGQVPYVLNVGNHDYISTRGGRATSRDTLLNQYFSAEDFKKWATFGGLMKEGELDNTYHLFTAGGIDWIVLSLVWAPQDETLAWADEIMEKYPNRRGILVTHCYLDVFGLRPDWKNKMKIKAFNPHFYSTPGSINDGEEVWNKLVKKHDFAFVFCGHVGTDALLRLDSKNDKGTITHQIMADFQDRPLGGEAYMVLIEFLPDGSTVQVKTYSPLYDNYMTEPLQQYTLKLK